MKQPDPIDHFIHQATQLLPKHFTTLREELAKNLRQSLQHLLQELSLVSRDEFDIQTRVLQRTREKLARLEQKVENLEKS